MYIVMLLFLKNFSCCKNIEMAGVVGYDNAQEDSTIESVSEEADSGLPGDEHMEEDTVAARPDKHEDDLNVPLAIFDQ